MSDARLGIRDGIAVTVPMLPGIIPFATLAGVTAVNAGMTPFEALGISLLIFAGASQLAVIQLWAQDASAWVMLATAVVINLRFAIYSAALVPLFHDARPLPRLGVAYTTTDLNFALAAIRLRPDMDLGYRLGFYLGNGFSIWLIWQTVTYIGAIAGTLIPPNWSLDFAMVLMFLTILVMSVRTWPHLVAALTGAAVAIVGHGWPYNSGLFVGAICGVIMGYLAKRGLRRAGVVQ